MSTSPLELSCSRKLTLYRFDAIRKAREWVASLDLRPQDYISPVAALPPRYPAEDLMSFIDPDIRKSFNMMEVLIRIVDDSRVLNFKPEYGRNLITAWASICGEFRKLRNQWCTLIDATCRLPCRYHCESDSCD